ncbi:MAG TPA: murein biosynthesis integral membrane protein MurJ [Thermoguttaceae bacterium]|nr:murein biosynthesis integral membrane protein MurJ [Thermoguttaceae bacterium]
MPRRDRHPLITGARVTSLGTLASRLLGMVRDMATAALLGLSGGGVMDAFVIAFRIPNLFRRLFGEGALAASYLPVLTAQLEEDRNVAWQLVSVGMTWLAVLLAGLVLLAEIACGLAWLAWGDVPGVGLLVGLSAVLMPYVLFICLAAQLAATLHALSHFSTPALVPVVLNVCWLVAAWVVAPCFAPDKQAQAYVLAASVLVAGVFQLGMQLPVLRAMGFRFDYNWAGSRAAIGRIVRAMGPMVLGLAITQINTLADSLIAWGLAAAPGGPERIDWLGGTVRYPMQQGAAAAIYYGERLYQFPLGILGLAVATAIFPLLSRHAARGDHRQLGADMTLGLRLVLFLGFPAGVGLIMLAEPLARLLFERGEFTPHDTARTARMIATYASGVWAYCALPVLVRGYYALGDRMTPVRVGLVVVGLNLAMNVMLIWPLAEAGLAVATAVSAAVQASLLAVLFSRRKSPLDWPILGATTARTALATLVMAAAGYTALHFIPPTGSFLNELARVFVPLVAGMAVFLATYWLLGGREVAILVSGVDKEA